MHRIILGLVLVAGLVVSIAAAEEPVLLAYKFTPGTTATYEMTGGGQVPLSITPGPEVGFPPMAFNIGLDLRQRTVNTCEAVDEQGWGTMAVKTPLLVVKSSIMVQDAPKEVLVTWENGKLTISADGQPQPQDDSAQKLAQLLGMTVRSRMSPTGESKMDAATTKMLANLTGAAFVGMPDLARLNALASALPDKPVVVGAKWSRAAELDSGGATLAGTADLCLAGFETIDGKACARITGKVRFSTAGQIPGGGMPGMPVRTTITRLDMDITFTNWLDLQVGSSLRTTTDLVQNATMILTVGDPNAQAMQIPAAVENAQMHFELIRK